MINLEFSTFHCIAGTLCVDRIQVYPPRSSLVMVNLDVSEHGHGPQHVTLDHQLRSMLQWVVASMADIPHIQLSPDRGLQQVIVCLSLLFSSIAVSASVLFVASINIHNRVEKKNLSFHV